MRTHRSVRVQVELLLNGVTVRVPLVLDEEALAVLTAATGKNEPTASPWLTVAAAAEYLGLTTHAVRKLVERRHVPKYQHVPGGRIMLRREDLDECLRQ